MPRIHEMLESKYLKKEDVADGALCTIAGVSRVNIAQEGESPEYKWTLNVEEFNKPLVLNSTNLQLLEKVCGSDDTDDWTGQKIVLYTDPNVSYAGKIVGGIRVRAVKKKAPAKPIALDHSDDDVPF